MISSYLPGNLEIATGFIVRNDNQVPGQNGQISTQIDLLIYNKSIPVVFKEGDFVIVLDTAVRGIIEIKSKVLNGGNAKQSLHSILTKLNQLKAFPALANQDGGRKIFIGVLSYEYDANFHAEQLATALAVSSGFVNHISLGKDYFIRFWETTEGLVPPVNILGPCYLKYNIDTLSFSYFISNLLHIVSDENPDDRYWFSFPLEDTKEMHRVGEPIPVQVG